MKLRSYCPNLIAATAFLAVTAFALQDQTSLHSGLSNMQLKRWLVAGKVTTLQGDPIRSAIVQIQPLNGSGDFKTIPSDFQGEFVSECYLDVKEVKGLIVKLTVTKKGFRKAQMTAEIADSETPPVIRITLRDVNEDPNLLAENDLISNLAHRLRKLEPSDGLSASAEKDYERGAGEFIDQNRPDKALPYFTKVAHADQACLQCLTMLGLAELGSGDWDGAKRDIGEGVNKILADPKGAHAEPLIAYGVMESWTHQPKNAAGYFSEALKYAPQDTLALEELGRSQLFLEKWGAASGYLAKAIAAGAGPEVRLLRIQALLGEGKPDEANKEMNTYLDGRDIKKMPLSIRTLWAEVQNKQKIEVAYTIVKSNPKKSIDYLHGTIPELKGIEPGSSQEQLSPILDAVGKNVSSFFQDFPNTVSLEQIHQEKLRHNGKSNGELDQKFHYLCIIPAEAWGPGFDEYRANLAGDQGEPIGLREGFMLTSGFASASLVFHPAYQSDSTFRYLGRQRVHDRDAFVVAFAQIPGKARVYGKFKSGSATMPTFTQGLAWIDAENYQIVRIRTDLLTPLPDVELEKQTTDIEFSETHFKDIAKAFWLPQNVTVTVDWNGKSLRNKHEYSDFKLFNVGATQKIGKPK